MSNFIKLSDVKLKEQEMKDARGGYIVNPITIPPILCYGVPIPDPNDPLNNDPY